MTTLTKTTWGIDQAHSEITFKVKHLMISNVKGNFAKFEGTVQSDDNNFSNANINFSMDASSITTGDTQRDTHLKSGDFFDAENHPSISFKSENFSKTGDDNYALNGQLTMKGVSKPVKLNVEFGGMMKDPWGQEKAGFTLSGKINRKDWGLNWNTALETGGVLVSEDVQIAAEIQLVKK
ncbi:MAG TPA: YceI family protein [Bacteroidia bacterium]|jgi:polyisoprenoid-binding protein YceI|nr:YceI family protein [Bacteroidia bacterium]HRF15881.1 YceI family protein [Bacteroidia bacterium]